MPTYDLSEDEQVNINPAGLTASQLLYERVINKVFSHYAIPLNVSDNIRASFRSKLWRMGIKLSKLGGKSRANQLNRWKEGEESTWSFVVNEVEVNRQLLHRKRKAENELKEQIAKRKKCEEEIKALKAKVEQQSSIITQSSHKTYTRKPLSDCTRQQQYNRKKEMIRNIQCSLNHSCNNEGFQPLNVELEQVDTGENVTVDITKGTFGYKPFQTNTTNKTLHSALYIKDKFTISYEAYHELSMISDLPSSTRIKKLAGTLNSHYDIRKCPNGIIGVQQSIKARIIQRITNFVEQASTEGISIPDKIRIKITGDGTRIARGLNIVNIAFTIIEERHKACSAFGNYTVAILRIAEDYEQLASGLQDICEEAEDLQIVTVQEKIYRIDLFLGGDWKFLATVCGIESATAEFSCIWCKCSKSQRADLDLEWSLTDPRKGARTTQEIKEKSVLGKKNKERFSCCRAPLFPFIPMEQVVIDTLHLFLRIADILINLLIRDLRIKDGINKASDIPCDSYSKSYEKYLNDVCKIRFKWNIDKESKEIKYRDLTGPEKVRLFKNIDIPIWFPTLTNKEKIGKLWGDFFSLISTINSEEFQNIEKLRADIKAWMKDFISIYQAKDVTPYMHAFLMHVPQFISLHGNLVLFTQQGLEKLNDISTKQFQRASNHKNIDALIQMLEKRNRIETLEDSGYQRTKRVYTCSECKIAGHNKRSCKLKST